MDEIFCATTIAGILSNDDDGAVVMDSEIVHCRDGKRQYSEELDVDIVLR